MDFKDILTHVACIKEHTPKDFKFMDLKMQLKSYNDGIFYHYFRQAVTIRKTLQYCEWLKIGSRYSSSHYQIKFKMDVTVFSYSSVYQNMVWVWFC